MLAASLVLLVAAGLFYNIPMCRYRNEEKKAKYEVMAGTWFAWYLDLIGRFFLAWVSFNLTGWRWEHYTFLFGGLLLTLIWIWFLKKLGFRGRGFKRRFPLSYVYQAVWVGMTVVVLIRVSWHLFR
ncbi:MAG: hypothetical protein ABIB97_05410 [Patescibacteria group bacterium]